MYFTSSAFEPLLLLENGPLLIATKWEPVKEVSSRANGLPQGSGLGLDKKC